MSNSFKETLLDQLRSDWRSNPATRTLVNDYTKFHVVLVVTGGFVALVALFFWHGLFGRMTSLGSRWRYRVTAAILQAAIAPVAISVRGTGG